MIIRNQKELDEILANATPEIKAQFAAQDGTDSQPPRIVTPVVKSTSPQWVRDALAERAKAKVISPSPVPLTDSPVTHRAVAPPNLNKVTVLLTFVLVFTVATFVSIVALVLQLKGLLP